MTNKEVYRIWAPVGVKWVDWVRPVPFISINDNFKFWKKENFEILNIKYIENLQKDTAIIVDLSGNRSIEEGIGLAKIGYRPIPVYNGTNEQKGSLPTVNNNFIETGLIRGAIELKNIVLAKDAPPAFLLDTNRLNMQRMSISIFDNSWDIYDQDLPSAKYFLNNGINKIIVVSSKIQRDLRKILYKFQKEKIKIFLTDGYNIPKEVNVRKTLIDKR